MFSAVRSGELALFAGGLAIGRSSEAALGESVTFVHDASLLTELDLVVETRDRLITVIVHDKSGEPLPRVRVGLLRPAEEVGGTLDVQLGTGTTDLDGQVVFQRVPAGELALRWPDGAHEQLDAGMDSFSLP